ncbi:alpha/beta family hydrolase [Pseudoalteromonas viridis]|uniref:Dienelactone hydrolase family protein n=1 Tax=Pseudoalteromonas viridis TaxID=339617 RepID=A0ABX7UZ40_9GAMM|nr:alpha/beta family hydrolase [Pseudoalteromonas viridis]QTL33899.1 dienelactone hydrolase family protein [Pseudoalteromonas viridis]
MTHSEVKIDIEWHQADAPLAQLILAHGAGAGRDSDFMQDMANRLSALGVTVGLFDFGYMQMAKALDKRRPPERAPKLLAHYRDVLSAQLDGLPVFIGGKSMGGRMASMLVCEDDIQVQGVFALGYPFHPPGKPEKLRTEHFADIPCPFVVLQGERDTFGNHAEVTALASQAEEKSWPELVWLKDGDHSLKPRKASGLTEAQNRQLAAEAIATKIAEILHG